MQAQSLGARDRPPNLAGSPEQCAPGVWESHHQWPHLTPRQIVTPQNDHQTTDTDTEAPGTETSATETSAPEAAEPMRFDATALDPRLVGALTKKGIETAFPIQELTLSMALRGQDVIGQARTGTGKTLAFGLPLLHRIDPDKGHVQALIVAPTRELTAQVCEDLQIGEARGLHVTSVYGGVPIEPQFEALKTAHVVVGTPGRLLDHLGRGTLKLGKVTELVLDEADEMLDMGFLPDVEQLISACPSEGRHTMLFSATMAPAIVSLARRYMDQPSFMHARSDEPQTADLVEQHFFQVHRMDKPRVLARIMQQPGREGCYVFTRTKAMADRLVTELDGLGVSAIAIHGDLRQATREKNLDTFRDGKASILVATEVAARGLDVDNVTHVVNYDCPQDDKMYLHRIGRTARAGRSGVAVTFAEHSEVDKLNVIRKAVGAFDGDLPAVFSTSDELAEIFDLPDETPWDHLSKRSSGSGRSSSNGSSKRDTGGGRKGSGGRGDSRDRKSSGGRDDSGGGRNSGNGRSGNRDRDDSRGRKESGGRDTGGRTSDRTSGDRNSDGGSGRERSSSSTGSRDRADDAKTRTRTRTRTRTNESGQDKADSSGGSRARARTSRPSDDDSTSSQSARPRARARARTSRTSNDRGGSDNQRGNDNDRGSDSKGGRDDSRSKGRSRASGSSGRSSSNRSSSSSSKGRSGGKRRTSTSANRAPERTTSEQLVSRGRDARGEGRPQPNRTVEVENLP